MTSAKNSTSRNGSTPLKQGTLAFSSAKRTNSITNDKKRPPARSSLAIEKEKKKADKIDVEVNNEEELEISSEEDSSAPTISMKRSHTAAQSRKNTIPNATKASASGSVKNLKEDLPGVTPAEQRSRSRLDVTAKNYRKHYDQVREKMGNLEPIHAQGQNRIHQILRVFDMSYEYGPCVGMTRLERWDRAASFGLNPPEEVRDILLTREGVDMDEYSQCVLYGEV